MSKDPKSVEVLDINPDTHFGYMSQDGKLLIAPRADSFVPVSCGMEECDLIHVIAYDKDNNPICEITFSHEQLLRLIWREGIEEEAGAKQKT